MIQNFWLFFQFNEYAHQKVEIHDSLLRVSFVVKSLNIEKR
jgi:hypothetical protein